MTNNKALYIIIIILVLVVIGGGLFFFFSNKGAQKEPGADQQTMVDCGEAKDPGCFFNRMNRCLPVTAKGTGSDSKTIFEMTVLGIENEKCHFQRKINNVLNLDCYFPKGTLNTDTIDQMFENDKGLQKVVDDACKSVTPPSTVKETMVYCDALKDPGCFINRMNGCLPATIKMTGSDSIIEIKLTMLGIENEKCHFQRIIDNVTDIDCYFPKGTLNWDIIYQIMGYDKGLQKVLDDNCKSKFGW